jgi:hypothetical protein
VLPDPRQACISRSDFSVVCISFRILVLEALCDIHEAHERTYREEPVGREQHKVRHVIPWNKQLVYSCPLIRARVRSCDQTSPKVAFISVVHSRTFAIVAFVCSITIGWVARGSAS